MSLFLNFKILFPILIPDPEKFAVEDIETGKLFDLFIEISSDTGYHPEPSLFYFRFAYAIGILSGVLTAYHLVWKTKLTVNKIENAAH